MAGQRGRGVVTSGQGPCVDADPTHSRLAEAGPEEQWVPERGQIWGGAARVGPAVTRAEAGGDSWRGPGRAIGAPWGRALRKGRTGCGPGRGAGWAGMARGAAIGSRPGTHRSPARCPSWRRRRCPSRRRRPGPVPELWRGGCWRRPAAPERAGRRRRRPLGLAALDAAPRPPPSPCFPRLSAPARPGTSTRVRCCPRSPPLIGLGVLD